MAGGHLVRTCLLAVFVIAPLFVAEAGEGRFAISGRPVPPESTNFAGDRHASPRFGIWVQINHDARPGSGFELTLVDEVFQRLLDHNRRRPLVPASYLPIVVVTEQKFRRFTGSPLRRGIGPLEDEFRRLNGVYISPVAIFISETSVGEWEHLVRVLTTGLGYLFDPEFFALLRRVDPSLEAQR